MSHTPDKTGFEPEIVLLYCQQCVSEGADVTAESQQLSDFSVRPVMMPCSSKIEVSYILKILEKGADAVEVAACAPDKCRFLVGSIRAEKRIEYIRQLLDEINIGSDRVGISRKLGLTAKKLISLAAARGEAVRPLGPNPTKKGDVK